MHTTLVVTTSQQRAAQITGISEHYIRNYGTTGTAMAGLEPNTHYVEVEKSGENPFIFSEQEIGVPMLWAEFKAKVDNHRKECPTHRDTLMKYAR
ncbi:MAG: hypothetical protein WC238_04760 [Parcubacteria group bacterium]